MRYTKEQRLDIGRRIYCGEINRYQAAELYGIGENTARYYMRLYRDANNLPPRRGERKSSLNSVSYKPPEESDTLETYEAMSKEELIKELVKAKIAAARLKKGYEVKGDGSVIHYSNKNTK